MIRPDSCLHGKKSVFVFCGRNKTAPGSVNIAGSLPQQEEKDQLLRYMNEGPTGRAFATGRHKLIKISLA